MIGLRPIFLLLWLLFVCHAVCVAQLRGVVYDVETHLPIGQVVVRINPKGSVMTDKFGRFTLPLTCHSVTFTRSGYESRSMRCDELRDTVWLMQKENMLEAVVVTAAKPKINFDINGIVRRETSSVGKKGDGIASFDFFSMFNFRKNRHDRNREKLKKILRDY